MEWGALLGPAITAAFISGAVSLVVVQLNFRAERKAERLRREEKVRDFQIALRAEIMSDLLNMQVADRSEFLSAVTGAYEADPAYVPVIPRLASNVIFDAIVSEIQILPSKVIGSVVRYERLRESLGHFAEDMRAQSFRELAPARQLLMYGDYLAMTDRLEALASEACDSLAASLGVSSSVADPSNPTPASAGDAASWGRQP